MIPIIEIIIQLLMYNDLDFIYFPFVLPNKYKYKFYSL